MTFMHRTIGATAIAAAALIVANLPAAADEITLSGSELSGLTYETGAGTGNSADAADASASFNGTDAVLSSGNTITVGASSTNAQFVAAMGDAGSVFINNGTTFGGSVTSFGTLNNILTQGASFTTSSVNGGAGGNTPYFQVMLVDPNNSANTLLINSINPGNNTFGISGSASLTGSGVYNNPFTQTGGGAFPTGFSTNPNAELWSTIAAVLDDGTALGNWDVEALGIGDGGFNGAGTTSADIDSISVPGVSATPLPPTWTMMLAGFAGFGWLLSRRRREGEAAARFA